MRIDVLGPGANAPRPDQRDVHSPTGAVPNRGVIEAVLGQETARIVPEAAPANLVALAAGHTARVDRPRADLTVLVGPGATTTRPWSMFFQECRLRWTSRPEYRLTRREVR